MITDLKKGKGKTHNFSVENVWPFATLWSTY
jgi:hypothetical protein